VWRRAAAWARLVVKGTLFRAVAWLTSLLPPRASRALARPVAWLLWRTFSRLRQVSRANLAVCYPQLSPAAREHRGQEAMFHYACNALEVGLGWHRSRPSFDALFEPAVGWSHFEAGLAAGKGLLFLAPHYGAWELLGLAVSRDLGATLYKPAGDPAVDRVLRERRGRFGANLVPANRRGLKVVMDRLRAGEAVGVLPDQEPRSGDGRFAPFFGVPALTGVLVPRLLQRTGARAVFAGCRRLRGGRFETHVIPAGADLYSPDLDTALAALNRGVEDIIALAPDQYLWGYKRFRARPDGARSVY